jgi:dihydropyrimidine dehydrogenase (NAD+) subunit PreA
MAETKKRFPKHALIASLMVENKREKWHEIVKAVESVGIDGMELNFGCPHGMSERGMGAAVGQHADLVRQQVEWVKEVAQTPVIAKLTPNITDIRFTARAACAGGADAISMINTVNSLAGVDVDTWLPLPHVDGKGAHGGYCGPAVKPIALHMVADCARDIDINIPISGMGGISTWRDAVEFLLMGATGVQICTAAMHHGFRIMEDLIDGLSNYLDQKGLSSVNELIGKATHTYTDWSNLNLNYKIVARVNQETCIHCNKCYIACEDTSHQCIDMIDDKVVVREEDCVGCNLCSIVCPIEGTIEMVQIPTEKAALSWNELQATNASL